MKTEKFEFKAGLDSPFSGGEKGAGECVQRPLNTKSLLS
jgi:hypothetical protein